MKYNILIIAAMCMILLFTGCKEKEKGHEKIQYVCTTTVTDASRLTAVNYPGRTRAVDDINVAFRVSGPIGRILVKEGDHVSKGQVIATMDSRDYQVQLNAAQAEYEQIKADAERVIAMYQEGSTTASNYDKARYGLQQITQKLNHCKNQLADTQLRAPVSGYIQDILHEAGETIGAGMPVISMFGSSAIEVEINISAFDYANRDRLNSAYCVFDLLPEERFPLKIVSISAEANASQLYTVRMAFTGPYDRTKITPGMTTMVYASIDNDEISTSTLVPTSSILVKEDKLHVFLYDRKSSTVKLTPVTVKRLHNDGLAEIISGIHDNDIVVTAGIHHLKDGQSVKPVPATSSSNVGKLL